MKPWQLKAVGILTLGGSIVGVGLMATFVPQAWSNLLLLLLVAFILSVYVYGIVIGVQILRKTEGSIRAAIPFWAAQVPLFSSEYVSYNFTTGGAISISFDANGIFHISPNIGSYASLTFGGDNVRMIGINVLAIAIVSMLLRQSKAVSNNAE